jgi:hypothetical protein
MRLILNIELSFDEAKMLTHALDDAAIRAEKMAAEVRDVAPPMHTFQESASRLRELRTKIFEAMTPQQ